MCKNSHIIKQLSCVSLHWLQMGLEHLYIVVPLRIPDEILVTKINKLTNS